MIIKNKLTKREFINLSLLLLYKRLVIQILNVLFCLGILGTILSNLTFHQVPISRIVPPLMLIAFFPLFTYFSARTKFNGKNRLTEAIEYQIDEDHFLVKGESFQSRYSWDKIYKVLQTKDWILIFQNPQIITPLPKHYFTQIDIRNLKIILSRQGVKNNL